MLAAGGEHMSREPMYGFFPGGDPREFTPDPECSTEEERARWEADCAAWNRGERPDVGPACTHHDLGDGAQAIFTRSFYGLGTYLVDWDEFEEIPDEP